MSSLESAAFDKSAETAQGIFNKLFGPAFEEYGLMFRDNIKVRRLNNQLRNLQKIKKIVSDHNITLKQVDLKVLVPYMDHVSLEENEALQDMWANLMANYVDAAKVLATTVYPSILSQLSTEEVRIMNELRKGSAMSYYSLFPEWKDYIDRQPLLNIIRLGLVEEVYEIDQSEKLNRIYRIPELEVKYKTTNKFRLTEFGRSLLIACER